MIVDSSALVAILLQEPDAEDYAEALLDGDEAFMSAATWLEVAIVAETRKHQNPQPELDAFIQSVGIEIVDLTVAHAAVAREAFARYGKGRHKAGLNFGDCFAYALAKATGQPLLYKGDDFKHTDIVSALELRRKRRRRS